MNTRLYIVEPKILKLITDNVKFDMTEFLNKAKKSKMKVGIFPVSLNSWIDIGKWFEYQKNINKLFI